MDLINDYIKRIQTNKMDYEKDLVDIYSLGLFGNGLYIQIQDNEKRTSYYNTKINKIRTEKIETWSWCRVWDNKKLIFMIEDNKYTTRKKLIDFLKNYSNDMQVVL